MEGCCNLGGFVFSSSSLSSLWLSDLHSLSKMVLSLQVHQFFVFLSHPLVPSVWFEIVFSVHCHAQVFNCPNLKEISLDFSRQETDSTDLTTVMDALGRSCPKLQNIHIASILLSHDAVLALSAANLRLVLVFYDWCQCFHFKFPENLYLLPCLGDCECFLLFLDQG